MSTPFDSDTGTVTFMASLPPIGSAIRLSGNGDGARVQLDVPGSDLMAVLMLAGAFTGRPLRVTIEATE